MMLQKHAYIIMAHNNFYCLEKLLVLLDDVRNDIFLHIDAKVKHFDFNKFQSLCKQSRVMYPERRINVQWGTQNQVKTEMLMFQIATNHGPYHYYHLISGSDLPLKIQDEIHTFFQNRDECFITIHETLTNYDYQRLSRYHGLFGRNAPWSKRLNRYCSVIQEKLNIDRIRGMQHMEIKRGWNWVSLPHCAVELLIKKKSFIRKITAYSLCADEMYKQIVLLNSDCSNIKICEDRSCLRLVDWKRAVGSHPHTFTTADFDVLCQSSMLFARKFDENVDREIIDMVFNYVMQQQLQEANE